MRPLLALVLILACAAPVAHAGKLIGERPDCPDQYASYKDLGAADYRAAVLCLMSAIREDQGLNALKHDGKLQEAGQKWANRLGKTGGASHGPSVAAIPKRIAKAGYKAAAVNEGLGLGAADATPYDVVGSMMTDFACTEILDPRFRDAGVGVNLGKLGGGFGKGIHVVVEFGLKAGAKVPSKKGRPAKTCSHRLPRPPSSPVAPVGVAPTVRDIDITVALQCVAKRPCTFDATLELVNRKATADAHVDALAAGKITGLVFAFSAEDLQAEQAARRPGVDLTLTSTKPFAFEDVFSIGI